MDVKYAEALSAFFDGEHVDGELLSESLAQPEAHALLADFAAMRAKAQRGAQPSAEVLDAIAATLEQAVQRRRWRNRLGRLAVAAGLLLVGGGAGFEWASTVQRAGRPTPARSVERSPAAPVGPSHTIATAPVAPAPAPRIHPVREKPRRTSEPPVATQRLRLVRWGEALAGAGGEGPRR